MKIGIDIRNISKKRTGDEVVFFELVRSLRNTNFTKLRSTNNNAKIKFYLFTDIGDEKILESIKRDLGIEKMEDFEVVPLVKNSTGFFALLRMTVLANKFIWNIWTLPKYLRKHPVDVYHTQYITPFFVPRKIKIITHIHDVSFKAYRQFIKWSDLFFLKILIPWSLKRADKIIAVSEFTKNEIIKYYFKSPLIPLFQRGKLKEKVEVVYNATSLRITNSYETTNKLREKIRKKYNLPERFILYMGTLQPRKNIPMLIKAYAKIKNKIPGIKLVIAGNRDAHNFDGEINEVMKQSALTPNPSPKGRGRIEADIIFPGFIEEKDKMILIGMARLFVFPSLYEGFGIPILEAMSQNVPVAASDIPSLSEVGGNAYIKFNPRDLDEVAEKLYTACADKDLRKKLINLGQSRVKFFSWEKAAEKMLKAYKEAAIG